MITVFTPTYNRAYSLPRLYESLKAQTFHDFEWLIVDDGSTDNTAEVVHGWIEEKSLNIHYIKTVNGGKHRAINKGVTLAKGELFFIVDSDDRLPGDSLYWVHRYYEEIQDDDLFAGVAASRAYPNGKKIGGSVSYEILDTDYVSFREKYKVKGDMAEVWRTDILRQYPFPEFDGEKFLTEAVVWDEIAKKYKLRYFNKAIYTCEYLPDGLTKNIRAHHRNSPQGTMLFYSRQMKDGRLRWISRMKAAANYWRYTIDYKGKRTSFPWWAFFLFPLGYVVYKFDLGKEIK
jgi:glycosyltransferase involved in cell wall biosynthesis